MSDKEVLMKYTFNVETSWERLGKVCSTTRCECAKCWINYWSFPLISVYLHDQRYAQRMDQSRQYDDLRGEWAQMRIEYAHNFVAEYCTPWEKSDESEISTTQISHRRHSARNSCATVAWYTVAKIGIYNLPLPIA